MLHEAGAQQTLPQIVCSTPPSVPRAGRVSWVSPSFTHQSSGPTALPLAALETVVVLDNSLVLTFLVCTCHCPHRPRARHTGDSPEGHGR